MLWQRVLTAAVGIPLALLLIYLGGWYLAAIVSLLSLVGLREYYRLAAACGARVRPVIGYLLALPVLLTPPPYQLIPVFALLFLWALVETVQLAVCLFRFRGKRFADILQGLPQNETAFGLLYVAWTFAHVTLLRASGQDSVPLLGTRFSVAAGACRLTLVIVACWATDIGAYAVGSTMGRHKLWPAVSPGKTIEGAVGGLLAAVLVTAFLGWWFGLPVVRGVVLGGLLGVCGQLGDLSQSAFKRRAGVKDSGAILPGHGGVLDRFDSLLINAPVGFYYLGGLGGLLGG